jgi:hypothetical protein
MQTMSQIKQYKTVALALLTAWALQEHHELVALKLVFVTLSQFACSIYGCFSTHVGYILFDIYFIFNFYC